MRLDRLFFVLDRLRQKIERIPAGYEDQTVGAEKLFQRSRIVRPAMTVFDAVETDLRGFPQDLIGGDVGSEGLIVIIGPGDGVGSETDHAQSSVDEFLPCRAFEVTGIGILEFICGADFRHSHVPPVTGIAEAGAVRRVRVDHDNRGNVALTSNCDLRFEIGDIPGLDGEGTHRSGMCHEVDFRLLLDVAILVEIVERLAAGALLQT
jgi:hypothetical protein